MERHIEFESCFNFRDLGGYQTQDGRSVRWRRLFWSDTPQFMTPSDVQYARTKLHIATVIDMRPASLAKERPSELSGPPTTYHNVPVQSIEEEEEYIQRSDRPDEALQYILTTSVSRLSAIFKILADGDAYPLVFHCRAGKDRSGILAALILSVLGVDEKDIVADFALSEKYIERLIDHRRSIGFGARMAELPDGFFASPCEVMQSLLTAVRAEHGSVVGLLEANGVTAQDFTGLRRAMLEEQG